MPPSVVSSDDDEPESLIVDIDQLQSHGKLPSLSDEVLLLTFLPASTLQTSPSSKLPASTPSRLYTHSTASTCSRFAASPKSRSRKSRRLSRSVCPMEPAS